MTVAHHHLWIVVLLLTTPGLGARAGAAAVPKWEAVDIQTASQEPSVTLFPITGPKSTVRLPEGLRNSTVIGFGPDGRAIYIKTGDGIIMVEFNPLRQTIVPGSAGLGSISSVTIAGSGHIFVSGMAGGRCGTFDIDPRSGTQRVVLAGAYPQCGRAEGVVAPDGRRAVRHVVGHLLITELGTGGSRTIGGFESKEASDDFAWFRRIAWSPDGRWISVVGDDGQIVLIDSDDTQRRRRLGSSSGGPVSWSPDSKYVLVSKSELRCSLYLYFSSLEAVEVETGKRIGIKSSRCEVGAAWFGWLEPSIGQ